jgi:hypothetical protein
MPGRTALWRESKTATLVTGWSITHARPSYLDECAVVHTVPPCMLDRRLLHVVPSLYTGIHKIHHTHHANLHVLSTLQMHPVDGLLTNTLPLLAVVALAPAASMWEFHAYMAYKTAQELFGHCGVHLKVCALATRTHTHQERAGACEHVRPESPTALLLKRSSFACNRRRLTHIRETRPDYKNRKRY